MWVIRFRVMTADRSPVIAEISLELLGLAAKDGRDVGELIRVELAGFDAVAWTPIAIVKVLP